MTYQAKVFAGGKIVIPADIRRELGIKEGDSLVLEQWDDGAIRISTFAQVVREEQRAFREAVGPHYSVDRFLEEKRADWRMED